MEMILFMAVGVALYLAADRLLNAIEVRHGERLPNRSVVFFFIFLALAFGSFSLIQALL
ncbi:MAG: hypothetical protein U5S82_05005 [Gammaproteobacteria bacterium]|nr:hypothetical protein [Gammaproteobacteria bacterium]